MKLGHVALDGTKVKANASKHKAMSYQRMKEKAAQLAAEVAELLRQAQAADDEEDRRYGEDKRGDELPQELAFREGRLGGRQGREGPLRTICLASPSGVYVVLRHLASRSRTQWRSSLLGRRAFPLPRHV